MNELDIILAFVILVGVGVGWQRGVLRVLTSILGIYITVPVAGYSYHIMGMALAGAFGLGKTMMWNFSYLVIVAVVTVIVEISSKLASEETRVRALGKMDNLLGALVGVLYGALWACLFLVPVQFGIYRTGGIWVNPVLGSTLVPKLNQLFQSGLLDPLRVVFINGIPELYHNPVSRRGASLLLDGTVREVVRFYLYLWLGWSL